MKAIAASALIVLASCGGPENRQANIITSVVSEPGDDGDDAGLGATDEIKGGETYNQFDVRRDSYEGSRGSFEGEGCTVDCGGHQAGYDWAEKKGITDPDDCGGTSWSFVEGCRAYAREQADDLEGGESE